MAGKKGKKAVICLSSSESEEDDDDDDDDDSDVEDEETSSQSCSDDGSNCSDEGSEWSDEEASSGSLEDDDDDDNDDDDNDDEGGSESTKPLDTEASCNKVIHLLKGGYDLQELKLEECKAYLRKHGLRLTGNKSVCVKRIQEHWRIKDGNGEKLYPRSSFVINCTGDVCRGDVVLFRQRVYERYDKVTRNGNPLGSRTIAGRVVKESYGAAKQQHTFTVEILWSKGFKRLPPLFPLLVKGRNLYRLKTFRQRWDDEEERSKVLTEKHKRGGAARHLRAMKRAKSANQGNKRGGESHRTSSPKRKRIEGCILSSPRKRQRGIVSKGKAPQNGNAKTKNVGKAKTKNVGNKKIPKSSLRKSMEEGHHQKDYWSQMQHQPKNFQFMGRGPCHVSSYEAPALDTARSTPFRPYTNPMAVPALRHQEHYHKNNGFPAYTEPMYQLGVRNGNHLVNQNSTYIQNPMGAQIYGGQRSGFLRCSMPGCGDLRADGCVVASCWGCCRRTGRKCPRHQRHFR